MIILYLATTLTAVLALSTVYLAPVQASDTQGREGRETMLKAYDSADNDGNGISSLAEVLAPIGKMLNGILPFSWC